MSLIDLTEILKTEPVSKGGFATCETQEQDTCTLFNSDAEAVVNLVQEGQTVHYVVRGAWDMHEMLTALLRRFGTADVFISSYAVNESAARTLALLKYDGLINELHCVIDNRVDTRSAGSLQLLRALTGNLTLCACHAKVTVLRFINGKSITVIGSANYTENLRYEVGLITCDPRVAAVHENWMHDAAQEFGNYQP